MTVRDDPHRLLSPRELEVLECYAEGMKGEQVCQELGIGYATVHEHTVTLRDKLYAKSIAHAVTIAFRNGLLK